MTMIETTCDYCGKIIFKTPSQFKRNKHNFCDKKCFANYNDKKEFIKCDYCGKVILKKKNDINNYNKHYCSRKCMFYAKREINEIIIKENYAEILLQNNLKALIDVEDIDKIKKYKWFARQDDKSKAYYVNAYDFKEIGEARKRLHLHRLIMDTPVHLFVDHINRNPLDNRKCNLRNVTHKENCNNRGYERKVS